MNGQAAPSAFERSAFEFAYTITGGTGKYHHADGRGLAFVNLSPASYGNVGSLSIRISQLATSLG